MNNAAFGMTVQKLICDEYNLVPNEWAKKQYSSNFDAAYISVKKIFPKIFKEIGAIPVKCLNFEKDDVNGGTINPHNFLLSNGLTLAVKTTKSRTNSKVAPKIVGQAGLQQLNEHFGHLTNKIIENQDDIRKFIWTNIADALPIFLDYLFLSDILLWIYIDKGKYKYKVIFREEKPDMVWDAEKFSFSKASIDEWKECITLKYDNISIAEIQLHKNRNFKFRFILDKLEMLFNKRKKNNETFGISVENAICNMFNLPKPAHLEKRSNKVIEEEVKDILMEIFHKIPEPIKYVGSEKGNLGKRSKSPIDFVLQGEKTLSLKTNTGSKVCPPQIGQPSVETFKKYFSDLIIDKNNFDKEAFKKLVFEHIDILMNNYLKYLFDCNYLLWIYKEKSIYKYQILSSNIDYTFEKEKFTFSRQLKDWTESLTVKYNGVTIGEFQVHKNRNSLKFRFDMKNIIKILEENGCSIY